MKLFLAIGLSLIVLDGSFAQELKKVGYTQLANDLFLSTKQNVEYRNIHFVNDLPDNGGEVFVTTYMIPAAPWKIYGGFKRYLESKGVAKDSLGRYVSHCKEIVIEGCKFDTDIRFSNISFRGSVSLVNNEFPNTSEDFIGPYGELFGGAVLVDSCHFESFSLLMRKEHPYRLFVKFNHSEAAYLQLELQKSTTQMLRSEVGKGALIQIHRESSLNIDSTLLESPNLDADIDLIDIRHSKIKSSKEGFLLFYLGSRNVELSDNEFDANIDLGFKEANLFVLSNTFKKKLTINFKALEKSSYVNLNSLKDLQFGILTRDTKYYDASTADQIRDDVSYKRYLRMNKTLYDHFREVGDMQSANNTYVRIREIENVKLEILYDSIPTFQNSFSLNLNRLLKFYTNYGTDPARAMAISFYIIFAFGIFYLFFPSDWDITSKSKLISNFKDFIEKNEKGYFKPFLTLMTGFLVSVINATTLSLNAFTTLGFGNIPTHGLARYICVVQGFIGWFLLSIFTVALINQAQF